MLFVNHLHSQSRKYAEWKTMRSILFAECIPNLICSWKSHVTVQKTIAEGPPVDHL